MRTITVGGPPVSDVQAARFWRKVDRSGGPEACWPWTGGRGGGQGLYGRFRVGALKHGAHRVAYALAVRPIPPGMVVMHACDNPPCCNPAHLTYGSEADNLADRDAKGRQASGRRSGRHTRPERTARGARNGRAKLSDADIPEILAAIGGGMSQREAAGVWGVHRSTVADVVHGRRWSHVAATLRDAVAMRELEAEAAPVDAAAEVA